METTGVVTRLKWKVGISRKADKQIRKLPKSIQSMLFLLVKDLEQHGPCTSGIWKHYSKLKGISGDKRHCHIIRKKTTYVCCWEVINKQVKLLEVYYVGTHEKAPYG